MSMIGNLVAISDAELEAVRAHAPAIVKLLYPGEGRSPERHFDLHKVWDIIHFLLTHGPARSPALDFIRDDRAIEDASLGGFGFNPTALTSSETRTFAEALASITTEALFEAWDLPAMLEAEVYMIGEESVRDDEQEWIGPYFDDMKEFVAAAAKDGLALVFHID
jgi:hypothetical protein